MPIEIQVKSPKIEMGVPVKQVGGGAVNSVNGQVGDVVLGASDVGAAEKEHEHSQYLTEHQDISGKADVGHKHSEYLTEHQSLDGYATEDYVVDQIDYYCHDFATRDEVQDAIGSIPQPDLSDYAKKSDIPDISGKADVEHTHSQYLTEHQSLDGYAKTTDIPDVSGFQTEAQVIALIEANMPASGDEVSY